MTPRNSWASLDLRHSAGDPLIPEILEHASPDVQDQLNETRRQTERQEALFALCPNHNENETGEAVERRMLASAPAEHLGHRVLVKCLELTYVLKEKTVERVTKVIIVGWIWRWNHCLHQWHFMMRKKGRKCQKRFISI